MRSVEEEVRAAQEGEGAAMERLVRRFRAVAVRTALLWLGDAAEAEDAAQDAFVEVWLSLGRLQNGKAFGAWLACVVRKHCDRRTRGKRREAVPLGEDLGAAGESEPGKALEQREQSRLLSAAIDELTPGARAAFLLHGAGYGGKEVAERLGISGAAARSRLFTARKQLRERLQKTMMHEESLEEAAFLAAVRTKVEEATARMAAGDKEEQGLRRLHPSARYRDPHPVFLLSSTLLRRAIELGVGEVRLWAGVPLWRVLFDGREAVHLTPAVGEALYERLRDAAAMDTQLVGRKQTGTIRLSCDGANYSVAVSAGDEAGDERFTLRLSRTD